MRDAQTVLAQLPAAFEHFNEVLPHASLNMRSPREFRRQEAAQVRQESSMYQALDCEKNGAGDTGHHQEHADPRVLRGSA